MTPQDPSPQLAEARALYQVPATTTVDAVITLLRSWGARPMPVGTQEGNLFDEFVEEDLVVHQASIEAPEWIADRLTDTEKQTLAMSLDDVVDEDFEADFADDPRERKLSPREEEWARMADALAEGRQVVIILERDRRFPEQVGNFRVHGLGQWVREALWAATGVLPRDPGPASGEQFRKAARAAAPQGGGRPLPLSERLGRYWPTYVRLMRPRWRRARERARSAQ